MGIRVSPVVSRRGYLSILEPGAANWMKRWVVVRHPYVFLYNSQKDNVERGLFNLTTTSVECSTEPRLQSSTPYTFAVSTACRGFLLKASNEADMHGWLYSFNPLIAGSIRRSKLARLNRKAEMWKKLDCDFSQTSSTWKFHVSIIPQRIDSWTFYKWQERTASIYHF